MIDVPRLLEELGIQAKARGHDLWAPCPLPEHKDAKPSWHITDSPNAPDHGLWHCFGCKEGGSAVDLVMAKIGTSYPSARAWLADRGIETDDLPAVDVEMTLLKRCKVEFTLPAEVVMGKWLTSWPTPASRYVVGRGIPATQIARWGIGYAVDGRLAGRVVFPFMGEDHALESYSARTWVRSNTTRYLTPSSEEGPCSDAVFGCQHWPPRSERHLVVVTEGAIDALACERATQGVSIAALSGSSLSPGQADRLASFERVLVATDPDKAGEAVAQAIAVLSRWTRLARVEIEPGFDAQRLEEERPGELAKRIDDAEASTW